MHHFGSSRRRFHNLKPGSVFIGTTSEPIYEPTPDLYDYAQTKPATMEYGEPLAKQLGP